MKSIQVREAPAELYSVLCEAAEAEGRSLSQQALAFMAKGANVSLNSKERRKKLLRNFKPFEVSKTFNAAASIAQDRER